MEREHITATIVIDMSRFTLGYYYSLAAYIALQGSRYTKNPLKDGAMEWTINYNIGKSRFYKKIVSKI